MSSDKETAYYIELQPGDKVQVWDQWLDQFGQWQFYTCTGGTEGVVGHGVKARRPIGKTNQTAFEEVPGSRTSQQAIDQTQRERIAYEDLQPGDVIQEGDEWRNEDGRWQPFTSLTGSRVQVRHSQRARRPHNITMMLREFASQAEVLAEVRVDEKRLFDDLELLRSEYAKLQNERDELKTALRESHAAHAFTTKQGLAACKERDEARAELGVALARVIAIERNLTETKKDAARIAQEYAEWSKEAEASSSQLQHERDEARAERDRLQEAVGNLYNEPTARQVQDMLRTWATELDWSAGCFDSVAREQIDTIQKTLIAVMERIETMIHQEGGTDE